MAFIDSPNEAAAKICQDSEQNFFASIWMLRESTLSLMQLFDLTQPRGPSGSSKSSKNGPIPGSLNKSWEFGGHA